MKQYEALLNSLKKIFWHSCQIGQDKTLVSQNHDKILQKTLNLEKFLKPMFFTTVLHGSCNELIIYKELTTNI